jgi:hypothetical protein
MTNFKFLIDTNIIIGLEDFRPVPESFAELARLSSEYNVALFVDDASYDDVGRDKDNVRQVVTRSKLGKFQKLRSVPVPDDVTLASQFGPINNENDRSDIHLLAVLDAKAADFLVTQDARLYRRAERAGLGDCVFTVEEALRWLKQTRVTRKHAQFMRGQKFLKFAPSRYVMSSKAKNLASCYSSRFFGSLSVMVMT